MKKIKPPSPGASRTIDLFGGNDHIEETKKRVSRKKPTQAQKKKRIVDIGTAIANKEPSEFLYQNQFLCSVFFPYKKIQSNSWEIQGGSYQLLIEARKVAKAAGGWEKHGIPYGSKPRVAIIQLNDAAMKQQSNVINVEESMSKFLKLMGLNPGGSTSTPFKKQLLKIAACDFTFAIYDKEDGRIEQSSGRFVDKMTLWQESDANQRFIWPEEVSLSHEYYNHLRKYAVPLDMRAVRALQTAPTELDIYCWLADRLHRVKKGRAELIKWNSLQFQFPINYSDYQRWRSEFRRRLRTVLTVYPKARVRDDYRGIILYNSPPPVLKYTRLAK